MMRSRRRSLRVSSRSGRQSLEWERFGAAFATVAGAVGPSEFPISSPVSFEPNVVDSNWTVRGIRLALSYAYNATVRVAEDQPIACLGVYKKDLSLAAVGDPSAPGTEDWLDLWQVQFVGPLAGELHGTPLNISHMASQRHIRAMRKLDQNEALFLTMNVFHFTAAQSTAFKLNVFMNVSQLWSRTLRK